MGNSADVKLQLDLILQKVLIAAGEIMIRLLMESNRRKLPRITRGEEKEFCRGACPLFLVKLKQPKTRGIFSSHQVTSVCTRKSLVKII